MAAGKGGGLLDAELVRQLAQTGDTYHGKANLKDSVIYVLISMMVVAVCVSVFLLLFGGS